MPWLNKTSSTLAWCELLFINGVRRVGRSAVCGVWSIVTCGVLFRFLFFYNIFECEGKAQIGTVKLDSERESYEIEVSGFGLRELGYQATFAGSSKTRAHRV